MKHDHFVQRAKQRFGLSFSEEDIESMRQSKGAVVEYQTGGRVVHGFEIGNQEIFVVFDEDNPVTALTRKMLERGYL